MDLTLKHKRIEWIDYARGIAIILVVYRHAFEGLKNTAAVNAQIYQYQLLETLNIFFFSFRMPLFFIVSGIFLQSSLVKRGVSKFMDMKARTILYPYFLWGSLQIIIQILFSSYINSDKNFSHLLYLLYAPREVEQFWYLLALFNTSVLFALSKYFLKLNATWNLSVGLILFYISAFCAQHKIELYFLSDIMHYYVFVVLGSVLSGSFLQGKLRKMVESSGILLILIAPFLISQWYFLTANIDHKHISPKFLYVEYYQPLLFMIIALTGCLFIISLSSFLERNKLFNWLRNTGKYSLEIYVMHVMAFACCRVIMIRLLDIQSIPLLLFGCIVGGVFIPFVIASIADKYRITNIFRLIETQSKRKPTQANNSLQPIQSIYEPS